MKYVVLVSHGMFAPGLHNALGMLAGETREDILSTSLENGMGADQFAENFRKLVSVVGKEDEILLFADLLGGSPLTVSANVLSQEGLLSQCKCTFTGGTAFTGDYVQRNESSDGTYSRYDEG